MSSIKFSKILIPIDGSESALHAVDYAIAIARKEETVQLVALHVLFFREESSITFIAKLAGTDANFEIPQNTKMEIEQWFGKVKEKADQSAVQLKTDIIISDKSVVKAILDYAETQCFDLIVIGRGKSSNFKNLLLGSITSGIVTRAQCPIMVIK